MKKTITRCLFTCLSTFSLFSAEQTDFFPQNPEEHVPVESRPMSPQLKQRMQEIRKEETEDHSKENESNSCMFEQANYKSGNTQLRLSKEHNAGYFLTSYANPFHAHYVTSVSLHGDSIELEDGSFWKIPSYKSHIPLSWHSSDLITITPNRCFCSKYNYYLNNTYNNTYVPADIYIGPIAFGTYTHWIIAIDYANGHLFLENGTSWCISANDSYLFQNWAINDTIIIGTNDSWFSSYDSILINVNMNNYIRVKQY